MWAALATCYEKLDKREEQIKCMQRVERVKDKEVVALHKLAKLYAQRGEEEKAEKCFRTNLERLDREQIHSNETIEALKFLALYNAERGQIHQA